MKKQITAMLSAQEVSDIKKLVEDISTKMPFLISLDRKEKNGLVKLGPKSADFASDAAEAARNFPDILPATFGAEQFQKSSSLFFSLTSIGMLLDSLQEKVNDTLIAVGSEAMTDALEVYAQVQISRAKKPGLKSVAEKLKVRFKKTPQAKKDDGLKKKDDPKKEDSPKKEDAPKKDDTPKKDD